MKDFYDHKDKLHALLEAAVCAIITIDENGIIRAINRSVEKMFLYKRKELIGINVNSLMPEPWASAHDGYLWNYRKTGHKKIIGTGREVQGLKSDGAIFPIHLSVSDYEADGEVFYTGIVHDLTAQKKAEDALRQAQKMETIGQLTGGIAHDFNNLLTVITGNLELLEMRIKDQAQLDLLKEALEAAELGADLTSRLLAFARKSVLKPEVVNLNILLNDIRPMLERTLGANINLQVSMTDELWNTIVDAGQIESIMLNLVVNARDAMPKGGQLLIETKNIEIDPEYAESEFGLKAGDYVCLTVSDTGKGMTEEIRHQAFEPFFTTKQKGNGTGLGLAMVHGFAKQSGGHVAIYSEPGLGTTVNLYIPRAISKIQDTRSASPSVAMVKKGNGEQILVVEDDARVRTITARRLEHLDYRVTTAENGDQALGILSDNSDFDLVFTDMIMPGKVAGYDLVKQIHKNYPEIAVLMTSGFAEDLINSDRLNSHAVKLLRKPYSHADLSTYIRDALGKSA